MQISLRHILSANFHADGKTKKLVKPAIKCRVMALRPGCNSTAKRAFLPVVSLDVGGSRSPVCWCARVTACSVVKSAKLIATACNCSVDLSVAQFNMYQSLERWFNSDLYSTFHLLHLLNVASLLPVSGARLGECLPMDYGTAHRASTQWSDHVLFSCASYNVFTSNCEREAERGACG